ETSSSDARFSQSCQVRSSIVGSIGTGKSSLLAYPSSKAAVNRAMVALAGEVKKQDVIVCVFNPGWVKTDMGGPSAELTVEDSVSALRRQFSSLTSADAGRFVDYHGETIPW
ncbi:MAG: SDR family NAD(P)-dependent oxidoreductase, partial [Pseudomonadota bacterium]